MKKYNKILTVLAATLLSATLGGCAAGGMEEGKESSPQTSSTEIVSPESPVENTVKYIRASSDGVNIRTGAGTEYASLGTTEKNTLYAYCGKSGSWYKTKYKNRTAYISEKYCTLTEMDKSDDELIESVIESGLNFLGVKYVYGAVRYHDGKGNKLKGFTESAFDCSSLMQYIFYHGAGVLLNTTTRTQVSQGVAVSKAKIKRGDLLFFTNASRKNNTGVERVGHVALYLGDNYILHTASDYAKIEQISNTRWSYFITARRMISP